VRGEGGKREGQKQDGLISRQRGPLIAPELRERGDSRDKGKKRGGGEEERGTQGGTVVSNATCSLGQPSALVSSRLPFRLGFIRAFPRRSLNSRRGEIYTKTWQCSRTRCRSGPAVFQVLFSPAYPHCLLLPCTHLRGRKRLQPSAEKCMMFGARL